MQFTRSLVGLVTLAGLVGLGGCGGTGKPSLDPITVLDSPITLPRDAATIQSATVTGDTLRLRVTYAGGLVEHRFALYGVGFKESYPVQVDVFLAHDARGDAGEALLTRDLSFDLSPLVQAYRESYASDGPIILRVHEPGATAPLSTAVRYEP